MSTKSTKGRRARALDSRGRPVPNLYRYDYADASGRARTTWLVGYKRNGKARMVRLDAMTVGFAPQDLSEARKAAGRYLAGLDEGRIAERDRITFADLFAEYQDSRRLSQRTRDHERHLLRRHLADLKDRRAQDVTAAEVARLMRGLRDQLAPWTQTAVLRVISGTFSLAVRRGVIPRSPVDGLAPSERPKQTNQKRIRRLAEPEVKALVAATASERWKAAVGLAAFGGLRLGEIRALRWGDVDLKANEIRVERSLLPDGTPKTTKTAAGERAVPLFPALRTLLVAWRVRSPRTADRDLVISTATGAPIPDRNLRRALGAAVTKAKIEVAEDERLSWHSLRHSAGSMLATDLELPATTLARIMGHTDPGFTLKVYARDARSQVDVTADVLARAKAAGVGV